MGILIFQIVIALIIYIASQAGSNAKTITVVVLLLFSLVMVKTSSLMGLQFITIIISALLFKSRNKEQNQKVTYEPAKYNPASQIDWHGDANGNPRSIAEIKKADRKRNNWILRKAFKEDVTIFGCALVLVLTIVGLLLLIL